MTSPISPSGGHDALGHLEEDCRTFVGTNMDGSVTYYVSDEYVTYPANESRYSQVGSYGGYQEYKHQAGFDSEDYYTGNRYSRDVQFAVRCPDEEMHGEAVALFDFTREYENELPLTQGQAIFVSYRHAQDWLVAVDPRTGESGFMPKEFVRLRRDIENELTSLNGNDADQTSPRKTDSQWAIILTWHTTPRIPDT